MGVVSIFITKLRKMFIQMRMKDHFWKLFQNSSHTGNSYMKISFTNNRLTGYYDLQQQDCQDQDKTNLFAEFFESVYKEHEDDNSLDPFIQNRNDEHCHIIDITLDIVKYVLSGLS